jgi:hypothetical protein
MHGEQHGGSCRDRRQGTSCVMLCTGVAHVSFSTAPHNTQVRDRPEDPPRRVVSCFQRGVEAVFLAMGSESTIRVVCPRDERVRPGKAIVLARQMAMIDGITMRLAYRRVDHSCRKDARCFRVAQHRLLCTYIVPDLEEA